MGAVIVKDGRVLAEGATEARPGDHAEVVALRKAGTEANGATLYCTLEPHAHQGTAPPCTEAIIGAGISNVVCALQDPNPQVNGKGFKRLRQAGVRVSQNVPLYIRWEAAEVIEGFVNHLKTGRPMVLAKYAMTIDGKIATRSGQSRWITGEKARLLAHQMRAEADAVIVGIGTVIADDPRLTARLPRGHGIEGPRPRLRVVLDSNGRLSAKAALLSEPGTVLWIRGEGAPRTTTKAGLEAIDLPRTGDRVDLGAVLTELGRRGCTTVMVEGGATLLGALFDARLVDKVAVFIAPVIFGGASAPTAVAGNGVESPDDGLRLRFKKASLGISVYPDSDFLVTGYVVK